MNHKIFRMCNYLLAAGLLVFASADCKASTGPQIFGSYQVVRKAAIGPQERVRMRIHLTNHGLLDVHIQRLTLADFSHSYKGATQACSIVVRRRASADIIQEFTFRRPEYEMWRRGTRPRLLIEVQTPGGRKVTQGVRLDAVAGGRGN
jgi:hypothetical protein